MFVLPGRAMARSRLFVQFVSTPAPNNLFRLLAQTRESRRNWKAEPTRDKNQSCVGNLRGQYTLAVAEHSPKKQNSLCLPPQWKPSVGDGCLLSEGTVNSLPEESTVEHLIRWANSSNYVSVCDHSINRLQFSFWDTPSSTARELSQTEFVGSVNQSDLITIQLAQRGLGIP